MAAFLIRCGADPNARSSFGDTALHIGIRGRLLGRKNDDEWQNSQYSVESLRDLITDYESSEASDIYQAIEDARIRIVETLLESKSINLNMANNQGDYPQHVIHFDRPYAASIFEKLVERGVDISQPNQAGQTCLHLAIIARNLEVVRKLVEENHDITLQDANGLSSFHYALSHGSLEVLQFISSACDSLTLKIWHSIDHLGKSPLHHHVSSLSCSAKVVSLLLKHGCDVNQSDGEGNSPLSLYVGSFHLSLRRDVFCLLVEKGADPLWINQKGQNLAHLLMHYQGSDIMILEFLFDLGLDSAATDVDGKTFIHHGAIHGVFTRDLLEFLERRGVLDLHITDLALKTPLHYAEEQAHLKSSEGMQVWNSQRWQELLTNLNAILLSRSGECSK